MQMQLTNLHNRGMIPPVFVQRSQKKLCILQTFVSFLVLTRWLVPFLMTRLKRFMLFFMWRKRQLGLLFYTNI